MIAHVYDDRLSDQLSFVEFVGATKFSLIDCLPIISSNIILLITLLINIYLCSS